MSTYRNLASADKAMRGSLERLSSGLRINRAADDAAGLAVSEGLKSQIDGLQVAARNAQDGINVAQIADGALAETTTILQRIRDLAVQASNAGSQDSDAQAAANTEYEELCNELNRISSTTTFGGQKLINAAEDGVVPMAEGYKGTFQVGASADPADQVEIDLTKTHLQAMTGWGTGARPSGVLKGIFGFSNGGLVLKQTNQTAGWYTDLSDTANATAVIDAAQNAIESIGTVRAYLGAVQNRFEHTLNNIKTSVENLSASRSAITDADMAQEMTVFSKSQVIAQAGTAMLAQAIQTPQSVLKLLS